MDEQGFPQEIIMMDSQVLQPLLGSNAIEIYPYIRKIDLMSSNSYLISTRDQIAFIDPGGLDDQLDNLFGIMASMYDARHRPVVIYLTHVHVDHCLKLDRCLECHDLGPILLAAQEKGALALETRDPNVTLANLLEKQLGEVTVDLKLLSSGDRGLSGERTIDLKGISLVCTCKSMKVLHLPVLESQVFQLGGGNQMEIYHTPGHSPDSICMRVGNVLFLGDLFFAPNPGMAGAYGWNQSDLLSSIQKIIWILEHQKIKLCCSGHGKIIDADNAWNTLKSLYEEVSSLSEIRDINPGWTRNMVVYAQDLMRELERVFLIIAGRLTYISHILAELEEMDEAEETKSLLNVDQIDRLFADFNYFALELRAGRRLNLELVHKAGQIVGKLDKVFENRKIGSIVDQSLLLRASRMLNDYAVTYRGFRPNCCAENADVNQIIKEVLDHIAHEPYEDEAILKAESSEDYLWALKARIAHIDLFQDMKINFREGQDLPLARIDKERFADALIDIFERLVGVQAKSIGIKTSWDGLWVSIHIQWFGPFENPFSGRVLRYFERTLALCGGFIQSYNSADSPVIKIDLVSAEAPIIGSPL
jgi:glyoxylase-like metal-dependent hydrolase (beta-lactamase superfamily II)